MCRLSPTFVRRRSHPRPRRYAPTTGPDPSPLQDFSLLFRPLLVSDAPGSRTFKPRLDRFNALFYLKENVEFLLLLKSLFVTHTTEGRPHGAALLQSAATQLGLFFNGASRIQILRCPQEIKSTGTSATPSGAI